MTVVSIETKRLPYRRQWANAVLMASSLPSPTVVFLLKIAELVMNDSGQNMWASQGYLAAQLELSQDSVGRYLRQAQAAGWLVKEWRHVDGVGLRLHWTPVIPDDVMGWAVELEKVQDKPCRAPGVAEPNVEELMIVESEAEAVERGRVQQQREDASRDLLGDVEEACANARCDVGWSLMADLCVELAALPPDLRDLATQRLVDWSRPREHRRGATAAAFMRGRFRAVLDQIWLRCAA